MHFTREQREDWHQSTRLSPFNAWMRSRVSAPDGTLDLNALWLLASEWGVDASRYLHLNPGQQRMNIGNRLRAVVPEHVYSSPGISPKLAAPSRQVAVAEVPREVASAAAEPHSGMSNSDLMRLYGSAVDALRARGVVRTGNAPIGDYAEHLFAKAFGWTLANNSASGHDAVDPTSKRYQIKARRLRSRAPGERQLSVIRGLPEVKFDMLAVVLFDRQFEVFRAALVPHEVVTRRSTFIRHVNGWRFSADDSIWQETGVRDVSSLLRAAAEER